MKPEGAVGRSIPRIDAVEKVTGEAVFTTDLDFPGIDRKSTRLNSSH